MTRKLRVRHDPIPAAEKFSAEELAIAARVRAEVEAMFGHARLAEGPEIGAYIHTPSREYPYDVYRNGYVEFAGTFAHESPLETDTEAAVQRTIDYLRVRYPDAAHQQLVWRLYPEFRYLKARSAVKSWGQQALPERVDLYLRLVVTPLGVKGAPKTEKVT